MKTTIEVNGYQIVVEELEGSVSVSALKDEEVVEEFTLESEETVEGEEMHAFGEEEDDFEEAEEELDNAREDLDDAEKDLDDAEEDLDNAEGGKLESFNSFIRKRR